MLNHPTVDKLQQLRLTGTSVNSRDLPVATGHHHLDGVGGLSQILLRYSINDVNQIGVS